MEQWLIGLLTGLGGLAYCAWGFINACKAAKNTPVKEVIDWLQLVITILPVVAGAFVAGYQMTPTSMADYIGLILTGFGIAAATKKLGLEDFFRESK